MRVALQALAAVLGGTQSLHCNGRDEALALPTEESARIALRTQQIIAHESGVANTVDPVGGSYAVEALTDAIERDARALLDRHRRDRAARWRRSSGAIQREIQEAAYEAQQAIDAGEQVVVGVNRFTDRRGGAGRRAADRSGARARQVERVRGVRAHARRGGWRAALDARPSTPHATARNLVPPIIAAVEAHATVGEIADALRAVFGEYPRGADQLRGTGGSIRVGRRLNRPYSAGLTANDA